MSSLINKIIVLIFCAISLVLQLAGMSTKKWCHIGEEKNSEILSLNFNLWTLCGTESYQNQSISNCMDLSTNNMERTSCFPMIQLNIVRTLTILSVLLLYLAIVCGLSCQDNNYILNLILTSFIANISASLLWSNVFTKINMNNFKEKPEVNSFILGYSYYLFFSGGILSFLTLGYCFLMCRN